MTDCVDESCPARAWVEWSGTARGTDFDGSDALFLMERVRCDAGHNYMRTHPGVSDPGPEKGDGDGD